MMEEEAIMELRTIKTLLSIDKREELNAIASEFTPIQREILGYLDPYEWKGLPTSDIADEMETSPNTVRNHRSDLEERNIVEKRGDDGGAEYRISGPPGLAGLIASAELLEMMELE